MDILKIAKFIEHNGFKLAVSLGIVVIMLSFYVFYVNGLGAIKAVAELQNNSAVLKEGLLNDVNKDLEMRTAKTNTLKNSPPNIRDIF